MSSRPAVQQTAGLDKVQDKYLGADMDVECAEDVNVGSASGIVYIPLRRGDKERVGSVIVLALRDANRQSIFRIAFIRNILAIALYTGSMCF